MVSENIKFPEDNPSAQFWKKFRELWKNNPIGFIDSINDQIDPFDRMGSGSMNVWQAIERGEIMAEEFDNAAVEWLNKIDISKILESHQTRSGFPVSYKIEDLLHIVTPNRRGVTKFPKAIEWFRKNKETLFAINIEPEVDGGHWENGVKEILKNNI